LLYCSFFIIADQRMRVQMCQAKHATPLRKKTVCVVDGVLTVHCSMFTSQRCGLAFASRRLDSQAGVSGCNFEGLACLPQVGFPIKNYRNVNWYHCAHCVSLHAITLVYKEKKRVQKWNMEKKKRKNGLTMGRLRIQCRYN